MFGAFWFFIAQYFYFMIGIPCMASFSFRYPKKYQIPCMIASVFLASFLWSYTINWIHILFSNVPFIPVYTLDQLTYFLYLALFCILLYKGSFFSMLLILFLSLSIAAQIGFLLGNFLEGFHLQSAYPVLTRTIRDVIGYAIYAVSISILSKCMINTDLYLKKKDHLLLLLIAMVNFILSNIFHDIFPLGNIPSFLFYLVCILTNCSIFYLIIRFTYAYKQMREQQAFVQEMKLSERTLSQMEETAVQMRELKHEISNYFIYAEELIRRQDYSDLQSYINKIIRTKLPEAETLYTENSVVNTIINQKNAYAKALNIKTEFSISIPKELPIDSLTLCSLFGNLLNNAIEACQSQENAFIKMAVHPVKAYLSIRIDNSVEENILTKNPHLMTTKQDADFHGNGIKILKKIVEKYDGMIHYELISPRCFSMQLMLKIF